MSAHSPTRTMLYKRREGAPNPGAWNLPLDTTIVEAAEVPAHQAKGWKLAADLHKPEEPKPPRARRAEPKPEA